MDDRKRMYFGHPINTYGTPLEARLLSAIRAAFLGWEIVNPNAPEHQEGYLEYGKTRVDEDGKPTGMGYFFEVVLPTCHGGTHLAFRDGLFGKGVFGEAEWQQRRDLPTWEILPDGTILTLRAPLDAARCLTREQTWARLSPDPERHEPLDATRFKPY